MNELDRLKMEIITLHVLFTGYLKALKDEEMQKFLEEVINSIKGLIYKIENKDLPVLIEDLELSTRVTYALKAENICTVRELLEKTYNELYSLPNLGRGSLREITEILKHHNLKLKELE